MGRSPCCDENGLKKGPWTPEEDQKLIDYIQKHGHGSWRALPKLAGLNRCGKSCRLRWTNYLRPDIKRGKFSEEEEQTILHLHSILGNKWSTIATHLEGRTDNEIKNFWNTHLKKKLIQMGYDPMTHRPRTDLFASLPNLIALAGLLEQHQLEEHAARLQSEALELAKIQYLQCLLQSNSSSITTTPSSSNSQFNSANLSISQMREISTPSLSVSDFENHATFSMGNPTDTSSQLLHDLIITSNNPIVPNPQILCDFQTHFNSSDDNVRQNMILDDHFTMVSQGDCAPGILPSPGSSTPPVLLTETSTSNVGDTSSTSSNGEGASTNWSELLFDAVFMHEIS